MSCRWAVVNLVAPFRQRSELGRVWDVGGTLVGVDKFDKGKMACHVKMLQQPFFGYHLCFEKVFLETFDTLQHMGDIRQARCIA